MSDKQASEMTEAELADYYYAHHNDADMVGDQVDYVAPRAARVAVRLSFEEEQHIREAAQSAGMMVSAFMRQVGLAAAAASVVDIDRLRRDLDEARARIDDAWQALARSGVRHRTVSGSDPAAGVGRPLALSRR